MILRVLGCSGSQAPGVDPCSFLIDERTVVDIGSAASVLSLEEQCGIHDVLLSHAHLDHVRDLPFLAENIFTRIERPVRIRGTTSTLAKLRNHLLNDAIWPDFASLPTMQKATLQYRPFETSEVLDLGPLEVVAIPVNHPGGCVAFLLQSESGVLVYSGDTGPTDALWEEIDRREGRVAAILVETTFPDRLHALAQVSGHLTPATLRVELGKLRLREVPIYVYHLKEATRSETLDDLQALEDPRIRVLQPGTTIEF
ncbi:MAG: MBL fold metallo-hydrolase [Candidatus Krumholzibacteriia bacterium]